MLNTIAGLLFVLILLAFANPFMLYMPSGVEYFALAVLAAIAAVFIGLVFREQARDEREEVLRAGAARWGYLAGIVGLTIGVIGPVLQGNHANPWLLGALAAMILARLISRSVNE